MTTSMWVPARHLSMAAHFGAGKHASALTTLYFGLMRGHPANNGIEPDATGGYARVAKTNDATLWGTIGATDVAVSNVGTSGLIAWPAATGLWSIVDSLDHWVVFDGTTGGNIWYAGPLSTPIVITGTGDVARLPAGTLAIDQAG